MKFIHLNHREQKGMSRKYEESTSVSLIHPILGDFFYHSNWTKETTMIKSQRPTVETPVISLLSPVIADAPLFSSLTPESLRSYQRSENVGATAQAIQDAMGFGSAFLLVRLQGR